ncbi:hypothetical protein GCM10028818_40730 [Spirosoma horti]
MPLLKRVVSTDDQIGTALAQQNPMEVNRLQQMRAGHIMAVGIGLSAITANGLPDVLKNGTQLSVLRKTDESTLLKALLILIGLTNDALNVPRMNPAQMLDAARHITKSFWYFKPEEIAYAFDQGRSGRYGKVYNRLDLEILEGWLLAYDTTERLALCERGRSEEQHQNENDNRLSVDAVRQSYQRFADGEPTLQQKRETQKRLEDQQERRERHNYHNFKEQYFASKTSSEPQDETDQ